MDNTSSRVIFQCLVSSVIFLARSISGDALDFHDLLTCHFPAAGNLPRHERALPSLSLSSRALTTNRGCKTNSAAAAAIRQTSVVLHLPQPTTQHQIVGSRVIANARSFIAMLARCVSLVLPHTHIAQEMFASSFPCFSQLPASLDPTTYVEWFW